MLKTQRGKFYSKTLGKLSINNHYLAIKILVVKTHGNIFSEGWFTCIIIRQH